MASTCVYIYIYYTFNICKDTCRSASKKKKKVIISPNHFCLTLEGIKQSLHSICFLTGLIYNKCCSGGVGGGALRSPGDTICLGHISSVSPPTALRPMPAMQRKHPHPALWELHVLQQIAHGLLPPWLT